MFSNLADNRLRGFLAFTVNLVSFVQSWPKGSREVASPPQLDHELAAF
jgi:hypothetical protein